MEETNQLNLGIGTRLQHTHFGPGVIVGIKYATYIISFINHGGRATDQPHPKLAQIMPDTISIEPET